ncbi:MAG: hypothetical protein WBC92_07005 [Terracidiphilus sp.]
MKDVVVAILFCVCLALGNQARCATLPDACGNDQVQFDVTTQKGQSAPAPPEAGKAQIVFVELTYGLAVTVRIGMDGQWVGADKGDSTYFTLDVTPGLHHLCASWQSSKSYWDRLVGLYALNAERGGTYYFLVKPVASEYFNDFTFAPLNEDEGKYLVKISALSTATRKK